RWPSFPRFSPKLRSICAISKLNSMVIGPVILSHMPSIFSSLVMVRNEHVENSGKGTITGLFATPRARIAPGVVYLRNADAALHLKELVLEAKDVIVVGGGFIGLEAAAS